MKKKFVIMRVREKKNQTHTTTRNFKKNGKEK